MGVRATLGKYNRVITNFFSLSLINGVSYLLGLLTLPYLVRVLGFDKFGAYNFIYVLAQYMLLVGNYGFRFSATRQISICRDDRDRVNTIFNATIWARLLISSAVSLAGLAVAVCFMDSSYVLMYLFSLGIVFGDIFIPVWLFQGMEEMKYLTVANVVSKLVFAGLIFICIRDASDYRYVVLLNSLGYIAAGVTGVLIARRRFGVRFSLPRMADVEAQFKDGWHIFVSNIGIELYRNSNVVLLRVFAGETAVGIYSAVEKLVKAVQTIMNALPMAMFPYVSRSFNASGTGRNVDVLKKLLRRAFCLLAVVAVAFALCSKPVALFVGLPHDTAKGLVWLLSPVLLFGCMNYIAGIVGLINLGAADKFQRNIWIAGITNIGLMFLFSREYTYYAAAAAWSIAETLLFLLCLCSINSLVRRKEGRA